MKGFVHRVSLVLGCVALCTGVVFGQTSAISGVPGDGIPDFYYFPSDGLTANTSLGPASAPAGTVLMDTDGTDAVAFFISGENLAGCTLCDGMNLPGEDALANASTWTVGQIAGTTQWIRSNPLQGRGFAGVTGHMYLDGADAPQDWPADVPPFLDFSDANVGVINYGMGAVFDPVLDDGTALWSAQLATDSGGVFYTNVTSVFVPEPAALGMMSFAGFALLALRRRR